MRGGSDNYRLEKSESLTTGVPCPNTERHKTAVSCPLGPSAVGRAADRYSQTVDDGPVSRRQSNRWQTDEQTLPVTPDVTTCPETQVPTTS